MVSPIPCAAVPYLKAKYDSQVALRKLKSQRSNPPALRGASPLMYTPSILRMYVTSNRAEKQARSRLTR